jgi:hypothetical protein
VKINIIINNEYGNDGIFFSGDTVNIILILPENQ